MALKLSSTSREFVRVPVEATEDGLPVNPTADDVSMAFLASGTEPEAADWQDAEWEVDGDTYYARCLVGPGGTIELPNGKYVVWVRIIDNPEIPVIPSGTLQIT